MSSYILKSSKDNCIGGAMVSVLPLNVRNSAFEPPLGPTADYKTALMSKNKDGWLRIRIMCLSEVKCLPLDCYDKICQ